MPVFTSDVSVDSTVGLTDTELRATPVAVDASSAPVPVTDNGGSLTVDGSVAVTGSVTVTGTVSSSQGIAGTNANGWPVKITDGTNILGTSSNPLQTISAIASSSTVTAITTTGSNITLLAANPNRKKAILYVETSTQYIKLGAGASTTSYTYKVTSNGTTIEITNWAGIIDSTGTSGKTILVTELS